MAGLQRPRAALLTFCCALILVAGCKKKNTIPVDSTITFEILHEVDGVPLQMDTLIYQNAAGNAFSVNRLEYYLSYFNFMDSDGRFVTLEEVIEFYNSQVQPSATLDPIMTKPGKENGLNLTAQQKEDLVNLMKALTDTTFTTNPTLAHP